MPAILVNTAGKRHQDRRTRNRFEGGALILFGALSRWLSGGEHGLEISYLLMLIPLGVASSLAIPAYFHYPRDIATAIASAENAKNADRD